jgi:hypothetical protein
MVVVDGSEIIPLTLDLPSSGPSVPLSGSSISLSESSLQLSGSSIQLSVPLSGSSISLSESSLQLSGSSIQLSIPSGPGEKTITAERLPGDRVRLTSGSESIIIANGASAVIAGSTVTVLADGTGVVVGGSSLIPLSNPPRENAGEILPGDSFSAVDSGRYVLIEHGDGTVTLADGAVTVVDGHTISAARDGGSVVVDGLVTQSVVASSTRVPESEASGIVEDADASSGAVASGSSGHSVSSMGTWRKVLTFGVLVGFMIK